MQKPVKFLKPVDYSYFNLKINKHAYSKHQITLENSDSENIKYRN